MFENHPVGYVRRNMFKDCIIDKYTSVIEKLRHRVDFTDDDSIGLQRKIDIFYDLWFKLCGKDGVTKYIHLLGAGHVMYYLKKYMNIYRFSNQALERLNNRLKVFYLQKYQRGGIISIPVRMSPHTHAQ